MVWVIIVIIITKVSVGSIIKTMVSLIASIPIKPLPIKCFS